MLKVYCEGCGNEIEDSDSALVRVYVGNGQYIFYFSGDEEGEHDRRHYCRACIVNKLDQEHRPLEAKAEGKGDLAGA